MNQFNISNRFSILAGLLFAAAGAKGQDVHFAQVQDMNIWYNPALKTNQETQLRVNLRNVSYQNMTAYTSGAATFELPLIGKAKKDQDNNPFMNLTAGINYDKSNGGIMNVATGMIAFSYAQPLDRHNTYLSAGFQAAYTSSKIALDGGNLFPDQFDKYGPIGSATSADPLQSGNTYGYFNVGVGIAAFHNSLKTQWYIGGSLRHLNKPFTDQIHSSTFRLPMNNGIQFGYSTWVTNDDAIGGYGIFTWQGGAYEHLIGALYTRNLDEKANSALLLGVGYRVNDAVIPNVGLKMGKNRFQLYYEINVSSIASSNYSRTAFEFSYLVNF
jgi:type IX secretion system PorP/SprF family membrane protein